jgi:hypothetical protein
MSVARRVGSAHLALAGVINGITALAVLYLSLSGWLLSLVITEGSRFATPAALLRSGDLAAFLATKVAPVVGVGLLVLAAVQIAGSYHAVDGRHRTWGIVAGVVGAVNVLALPVSLIAAVLLGVDRPE